MEPPSRVERSSAVRLRSFTGRLVAGPILAALTVVGLYAWSQQPSALTRVPHVVGVDSDAALRRLVDVGFAAQVVERPGPGVAGTVVEQEPGADAFHDRGSAVVIVVTTGADQVTVPEVTSMPVDEARDAIVTAGLEVTEVVYRAHPEREPGRVVRTEPGAGSTVDEGTGVVIHAARDLDEGTSRQHADR